MKIGEKAVDQIIIHSDDGGVLAIITDEHIVEKDNVNVALDEALS